MESENPPRYSEIIMNVPDLPDGLSPTVQTGSADNQQTDHVNRNQHFPNSPSFPASTTANGTGASSVLPPTEPSDFSDSNRQQSNGNRNPHFPNSPTFPASSSPQNTATVVNVDNISIQPAYLPPTQQHTYSQPIFGHIVGVCPACRVGHLQEKFTCFGWCCCFFFFPLGLICLFTVRERVCYNCGLIVRDC